MTTWLRAALRATGPLIVLGAVVLPCGSALSYGVAAAPSAPASSSSASSAPASSSSAPSSSASPSAGGSSPSRSPEPSRAGSRAGEGRQRPGRSGEPAKEVEGDDTAEPEEEGEESEAGEDGGGVTGTPKATSASQSPDEAGVVPSASPNRPTSQPIAQTERSAEPVLRILPLGSGLVLIGLGLGLAFVALRVRRS
ncbi:hypothetical protein ABZV31_25465 [Streptomyces sp. NPDC005202]|uniref:hypothetical protein n=1 Tax=Streptomyces sp. NPDC005202 TaxID=3157021 RepID=UPI0033BA9E3E